jgi:acetoin utilization protein AcuB
MTHRVSFTNLANILRIFSRFREFFLEFPRFRRFRSGMRCAGCSARRQRMPNSQIRAWMTNVPPTVSPKESVRRARALLHTAKAAEILVIDNGKLVGMLNERDIWRHCPTSTMMMDEQRVNELLDQFRVGAVMALHPPVITPDAELADAAGLFVTSGRGGIPVVEDGTPIGFLTETNFLHAAELLLKAGGHKNTQ